MSDIKTVSIIDVPDIKPGLSETEVTLSIERYIDGLASAGEVKPKHNDLLGFFELIQNAIRTRELSDKVPENKRLLVLAEDPPEEIDTEAITFVITSRTPGQISRGSIGEGKVKEVIAHLRSIQQHPEHPGEKLVTMGKVFDNVIEFHVYARNNSTAMKRVLWLENVLDSFRWYFRVHGIQQVIEIEVGKKQLVNIGELLLTMYPMSYFVRTEDIYQFGSQELKYIELNVGLTTDN